MYIDSQTYTTKYGKTHTRHLLRESFRQKGISKKRTIANISHLPIEKIRALKIILNHKLDLLQLSAIPKARVSFTQRVPVGATLLLIELARQLGITKALGDSREGKLALWQVIARVLDQGSRLSAVRLGHSHAADQLLGTQGFNEDHLYATLDWLCEEQEAIEDKLFASRYASGKRPSLYLYDVTSSYLEGWHNELADFGYNRDGKKGKKQIVIGMLCDQSGVPISVEVFEGNTSDPQTVASQIEKISKRFDGAGITLVGDRGMIKSRQMRDLITHKFHYITAITKAQIRRLIKNEILQPSLFDIELAEIQEGKIRYILRKNPVRAREIRRNRKEKLQRIRHHLAQENRYLKEHPRAKPPCAVKRLQAKITHLKLQSYLSIQLENRHLKTTLDKAAWQQNKELDGCYVLKSDLSAQEADKETIHARYKDLTQVEKCFRDSKTVELEIRPLYLRLAKRTRGHILIVMLAYHLLKHLRSAWSGLDLKVKEGLRELDRISVLDFEMDGQLITQLIPKPNAMSAELLKRCNVKLPSSIKLKTEVPAKNSEFLKNIKEFVVL